MPACIGVHSVHGAGEIFQITQTVENPSTGVLRKKLLFKGDFRKRSSADPKFEGHARGRKRRRFKKCTWASERKLDQGSPSFATPFSEIIMLPRHLLPLSTALASSDGCVVGDIGSPQGESLLQNGMFRMLVGSLKLLGPRITSNRQTEGFSTQKTMQAEQPKHKMSRKRSNGNHLLTQTRQRRQKIEQ